MTNYTPLVWDASTPVSAENLHHIETQADALQAESDAVDHSGDYHTVAYYAANFHACPGVGHGSGADADRLSGMTLAEIQAASVPKDSVIMWHGNKASPPSGFALCDGSVEGAPNFSDALPLGGSSVRTTGGESTSVVSGYASIASTTLTILQLPHHLHRIVDEYPADLTHCNSGGGAYEQNYTWEKFSDYTGGGGSHTHGATLSGSVANYPPCKAVHFLIKT